MLRLNTVVVSSIDELLSSFNDPVTSTEPGEDDRVAAQKLSEPNLVDNYPDIVDTKYLIFEPKIHFCKNPIFGIQVGSTSKQDRPHVRAPTSTRRSESPKVTVPISLSMSPQREAEEKVEIPCTITNNNAMKSRSHQILIRNSRLTTKSSIKRKIKILLHISPTRPSEKAEHLTCTINKSSISNPVHVSIPDIHEIYNSKGDSSEVKRRKIAKHSDVLDPTVITKPPSGLTERQIRDYMIRKNNYRKYKRFYPDDPNLGVINVKPEHRRTLNSTTAMSQHQRYKTKRALNSNIPPEQKEDIPQLGEVEVVRRNSAFLKANENGKDAEPKDGSKLIRSKSSRRSSISNKPSDASKITYHAIPKQVTTDGNTTMQGTSAYYHQDVLVIEGVTIEEQKVRKVETSVAAREKLFPRRKPKSDNQLKKEGRNVISTVLDRAKSLWKQRSKLIDISNVKVPSNLQSRI